MCPLARIPGVGFRHRPDGEAARRTIRPLGPLPLTLALTMALLAGEDGATRADDDDPGASPPDMRPL